MTTPVTRKRWSAEEAMAAQMKFQAGGGDAGDPSGPVSRWAALLELDALRKRFARGDKHALMIALSQCARCELLMPKWVRSAYLKAYQAVNNYDVEGWDDVFGRNVPKGKHLAALRKQRVHSKAVWARIRQESHRGVSIDDELFARIGKALGLGRTLTKQYYYLEKRGLLGTIRRLPQKR